MLQTTSTPALSQSDKEAIVKANIRRIYRDRPVPAAVRYVLQPTEDAVRQIEAAKAKRARRAAKRKVAA